MTFEDFQKRAIRSTWFDTSVRYLFFLSLIPTGIFFLYDVIVHQEKYDHYGTRYGGYFLSLFLPGLGIAGIFLIRNFSKVTTVNSILPLDKKRKLIEEVLKELRDPFCYVDGDFYDITYYKNWWIAGYRIYLSFDEANFYISIQGRWRRYRNSIIDFNGTKKLRTKLISGLTNVE